MATCLAVSLQSLYVTIHLFGSQQPWPRTAVEKLLAEMFEGSAAQFLAILETLADSTRRTLLTSPAAADTEDYILDTFSELFFAGLEIISGEERPE